jgi:alkyl sulfatase BDS1-like metallo-beta-lactamase superfamily hydrolase
MKTITIPVPIAVLKAMRLVCAYLHDEQKDYINQGKPHRHIYERIQLIDMFLNRYITKIRKGVKS